MLVLSVTIWAGLVVAGLRRARLARAGRVRLLTGQLGRSVTVVRSTGTTFRSTRSAVAGEVVGVERDRLILDRDGQEITVPIAAIQEIWSGAERLGIW